MADIDAQLRAPEQPLLSSNLRYMGFVNDVGEALHSFLPKPIYVRGQPPPPKLPPPPLSLSACLPCSAALTPHLSRPLLFRRWAPT